MEDEIRQVNVDDRVGLRRLLEHTVQTCRTQLEKLKQHALDIPQELRATHSLLVRLRRDLVMRQVMINVGLTPSVGDALTVSKLRLRLQELDSRRLNGKFLVKQPSDEKDADEEVQERMNRGQSWLANLMETCQTDLQRITAIKRSKSSSTSLSGSSLSSSVQCIDFGSANGLIAELLSIKHDLERSLITRRWTFRETDLWEPWVRLAKCINKMIIMNAGEISSATRVGLDACQFLAWKCRGLVLRLLRPDAAQARVAPELVAIRNQLLTLRKCLEELKRLGGEFSGIFSDVF